MRIEFAVAFGSIAVAPFMGRWRARAWLKKNRTAERNLKSVPEIA